MAERRRSIHRDEKASSERKQSLSRCDNCEDYYVNAEDETPVKLTDLEAWESLHKKMPDSYPNLTDALQFQCQECGNEPGAPEAAVPAEGKTWTFYISIFIPIVAVLVIIIAVFTSEHFESFIWGRRSFKVNIHKQSTQDKVLDDELYGLEKNYPRQQERVWYTLAAGVKSVLNTTPNQPSVFLMLYETEDAGRTAKCIAKDVVRSATKYLMKRSKEPVQFSGAELHKSYLIDDPGLLLVEYNSTVRDRGALVVTDLHDVPPKVATSFHYFCDRYSPLVERAIYFFTLKVDQAPKKLQKAAEDRLRDLWSNHMTENVLQPLITRLTSNVLVIFSDSANC